MNLLESELFWDNAIMMVLLSMILEFFGCIFIAFCTAHAHTSNFIEPKSIIILVHFTQAADLGGIFGGKAFGKNKLIPSVSPGKTVEGIIGCFLHAQVWAYVQYACGEKLQGSFCLRLPLKEYMILGFVCTALAILGDLC